MSESRPLSSRYSFKSVAADSDLDRDFLHKAWHLCFLVLSLGYGRPHPLAELASSCTLFPASSDFIKFLCSIPNSPISLSSDGFSVTASFPSFLALPSYMSSLGLSLDALPPQVRSFLDWSILKRKRGSLGCSTEGVEAEEWGLTSVPKRMRNTCGDEVCYDRSDCISRNSNTESRNLSSLLNRSMLELLTVLESRAVNVRCSSVVPDIMKNETYIDTALQIRHHGQQLMACELNPPCGPATRTPDHNLNPCSGPLTKRLNDSLNATSSADVNSTNCIQENNQGTVSLIDVTDVNPIEVGDVHPLEVGDVHLLEVGGVRLLEVGDFDLNEVGDANQLEVGDDNQLEVGDFDLNEVVDADQLEFEVADQVKDSEFDLLEFTDFNVHEFGDVNQLEEDFNPSKVGDISPLGLEDGIMPEVRTAISYEAGDVNVVCEMTRMGIAKSKAVKEQEAEELIDHCALIGGKQNLPPPSNALTSCIAPETEFEGVDVVEDTMDSLSNNPGKQENPANNQQLSRSSCMSPANLRVAVPEPQDLCRSEGGCNKASTASPEKQHCETNQHSAGRAQKSKQKACEARKGHSISLSFKNLSKQNSFPDFESYIVEEEEGSGGYGTVYRAQRKTDGTMVAIKCPHADAHKHHVSNELKMLERFGGKSFVIRYEGCFKSENSDCFVLQHVEHDRPEVLKREIDVIQLQWYGYCMFTALASLHKQGVVHRDVKPGNFLFSRKTNKGYLIDFNLALDLHKKYRPNDKSKTIGDLGLKHVAPQKDKSKLPTTSKKHPTTKLPNTIHRKATNSSRSTLGPNNPQKLAGNLRASEESRKWNQFNSQGAEGSGTISAKDGTSTKIKRSGDRRREPLPCHGRKELISYLQETMASSNHEALKVPLRKRIAALPGKVEKEPFCLTPMPLKTNSRPVTGAGLMNKGSGNQNKEGPCAGTKGFRAPEVCFRSSHQGAKIDIWSAGVTLLYLIIGKTPFTGDPEQNIKEIARLRGSEDLWEVAKVHNRESSLPEELYDFQYLPSTDLREWCRMNTKRQDFVESIPRSLLDLVDRCLTVNPRLRISAEDALKHDFFAPIYECLKQQKIKHGGV